ncbi:MAG TPA: DUF4352 domain-containing protein [Polyangiaceae bacterium]|nr:DUF4352 domain-containing protein [Polyangiaceae bacterium]
MRAPGFTVPARPWALLPLASAVACHARADGPPPPPSPSAESATILGGEPRVHPEGELAVLRDYTMSVESDKECREDTPFASKRGYVKFGIEVTLEGTSAVEVPVNPFYATLYDSNGDVYTSTLAGCDPGLVSMRVTTGKKARGFITFEIPATSRKLELHYEPTIIGRTAEEARFVVVR